MADDKSKRDSRDRDRVSADDDYEVQYFAKKAGITPQQAKDLIAKHLARRWRGKRRQWGSDR